MVTLLGDRASAQSSDQIGSNAMRPGISGSEAWPRSSRKRKPENPGTAGVPPASFSWEEAARGEPAIGPYDGAPRQRFFATLGECGWRCLNLCAFLGVFRFAK